MTERVVEAGYMAEVEVELMDDEDPSAGWGPYLTPQACRKLDEVRLALQRGDVKAAMAVAKVYRVTPITAA
ncbi:MAG TPA: hypothetical protein VK324_01030 [Tepidisphaeraceae bacterium]|nr:hypothetical protein [Tepidisphaeraceae bacterium]